MDGALLFLPSVRHFSYDTQGETPCRAAGELGFNPILVADAHTCMDTPALPARSIIDHHNATLNGAFAKVLNTVDM